VHDNGLPDGLARVAERFQAKLRQEGEHQVWTGATNKGVGAFKLDGRTERAPRIAGLLEQDLGLALLPGQ
jgi:hypothetical protein